MISIPVGLAAFYFYPLLAMQLEDNPAVWGVGTLQKFVFAFAGIAIANGLGGLFIKLVFPNVFTFKDHAFEYSFNQLNPAQKCAFLLSAFSVYFLGYILLLTAL